MKNTLPTNLTSKNLSPVNHTLKDCEVLKGMRGNLILHNFKDWRCKEKQKKRKPSQMPLNMQTALLLSLSESTIPTVLVLFPEFVIDTEMVEILEYSISSE